LVDVGGWRLHLHCTGKNEQNAPTVVLESGSGDFSFDWSLVQPGVARFTSVCSYDRAGNAWSDLGPRPRTMRQVVYELHTALQKTGIKGPYVLIGQSVGGLLIRTFAGQYPKETAGMVLVDATHEDAQLNINGKIQRMRELSEGRTIPPIQTTISAADKTLPAEERQQIEDFLKQLGPPKIEPPFDRLPPEVQDEDRKRLQADLLKLSRNSKQIIAETSGHHIQHDDPELVIEAIRQVVDSAQNHTKLAP
jgi:pimeloyl-ACP methyl ester carboxylesterase